MTPLPAPQTLANLASAAVLAFHDVPLSFNGECGDLRNTPETMTIMVPLMGKPLYIITACANHQGGAALANAMSSCRDSQPTPDIIEDALRELCSIIAAALKSSFAAEHEVGLSSRLTDNRTLQDIRQRSGARLRVGTQPPGEVEIEIAEFEGFV